MNCLKENRALTPLDVSRGDTAATVLEIVTYRLAPGANRDAFLTSVQKIDGWLQERGTARQRLLSESEDGTWTETVEWVSMEAAKAAAEDFPKVPEFAPIMQAIDEKSVTLRHETVRWRMN